MNAMTVAHLDDVGSSMSDTEQPVTDGLVGCAAVGLICIVGVVALLALRFSPGTIPITQLGLLIRAVPLRIVRNAMPEGPSLHALSLLRI